MREADRCVIDACQLGATKESKEGFRYPIGTLRSVIRNLSVLKGNRSLAFDLLD